MTRKRVTAPVGPVVFDGKRGVEPSCRIAGPYSSARVCCNVLGGVVLAGAVVLIGGLVCRGSLWCSLPGWRASMTPSIAPSTPESS
jgi:hypothetical protein